MNGLVAHTEYVSIKTTERYEILDITDRVEEVRKKARLADGFILVSTMHITKSACIFANEKERLQL